MPNHRNTAGRTGANILLDVLESEGCEFIFGNPGTTELPLIDALVDRSHLHYVLGLQEATVVAMASVTANSPSDYCPSAWWPGAITKPASTSLHWSRVLAGFRLTSCRNISSRHPPSSTSPAR